MSINAQSLWREAGGPPITLRTFAIAAAGDSLKGMPQSVLDSPEAAHLIKHLNAVSPGAEPWNRSLIHYLARSHPSDRPLLELAAFINLTTLELLAISLTRSAEEDLMTGRSLAFLQAPVGGSRPTLGLVASIFQPADPTGRPLELLASGPAFDSGLIGYLDERQPLPERTLTMPPALLRALSGLPGDWPGSTTAAGGPEVRLPESAVAEARRHASALCAGPRRCLVVRTPSPAEGRTVIEEICGSMGTTPLYITQEHLRGLGPYLKLRGNTPVFCIDSSPGERKTLPSVPYYEGPVMALSGTDGSIESAGGPAIGWTLPIPPRSERLTLWKQALGDEGLAEDLARHHRHGAGRIAHLARLAQHQASLRGIDKPGIGEVIAASWTSEGSALESLAEPMRDRIGDDAIVLPPLVRADLEHLLARCRGRDELAGGLGASVQARYRLGVRALLTGPSGSGKTLAAGWLATRLGIPLYRVDLASVMSKYIGETEKNLAQLLARAEQADIMLLFDEADSLFGKRTDIKEANDRFANAQTNYLLQRIESFDGITLLTSNSRNRFDAAFTRRLDSIIEFSNPGPEERRALWLSHLGPGHPITPKQINELAAVADLSGGHIRNAVLTAAVVAQDTDRRICWADLLVGLAAEYRKLGKQLPPPLVPGPRG